MLQRKSFTSSRGHRYTYYCHVPRAPRSTLDREEPSLPTLLFLHGFPTNSRLWKHQAEFFALKGFPLIIPDLLGFGESAKPMDPAQYRLKLVCQDVGELLRVECAEHVIVVGHDLGCHVASRLAHLYPGRFLGFAFLSVPYTVPQPHLSMDDVARDTKKSGGYERCGNVVFYADDEAGVVIRNNINSFCSVMFPEDPKLWVRTVAPLNGLKNWLETNGQTETAPFVDMEDLTVWRNDLLGGVESMLCWYKALALGYNREDEEEIPLGRYVLKKPVFYAATTQDYLWPAVSGIATVRRYCSNATIREFHTGHWVMLSQASKLNAALYSWIMDVSVDIS